MYDLRAKSPVPGGPSQPLRPGELLTSHLRKTLEALLLIQARVGHIPSLPDAFWQWAALAALFHDAGKLPEGFQRMIGNTVEPPHIWGQRHEVLSLGFVSLLLDNLSAGERLWISAAVAGHHRAFTGGADARKIPIFTQYGTDNAETFSALFLPANEKKFTQLCNWLHRTARSFELPVSGNVPYATLDELTTRAHASLEELMDRWEHGLDFGDEDGLTAVLLLGAVTMADHLSSASAHTSLHTQQPLPADYRARLITHLAAHGHTLRYQQQQAAETHGHMLLRSWTASGKTEGSLLWARTQITDLATHCGGVPRLFYTLPYLASINAMTDRLARDLGTEDGIGVAHSKAASFHLARSLSDGCAGDDEDPADAADKAHSRAQATRNFRELLRVGTPYQLLRGALAGPVHSSILIDSANSVFILDELHAFDAHRLGMILAMMRLWEHIGGRIAVLSATLPTALAELVTQTLTQPVQLVEPPVDVAAPARHRIHTRAAHLTDPISIAEMRAQLDADHSVLVVANNVKDAIMLYEALAPDCVDRHGPDSAFLLHSRFKRMDRDTIEKTILERFEVGRPRRPGLLVGTQALEVSLNIDLDLCHTSAADLEALLQRFGRANRIGSLPAVPVVIHQPEYRIRDGAMWADGVYEEAPTQLAWDILNRHDGQIVNEKQTTAWLDEVYASPWGELWRVSVEEHRKTFEEAFLTFRKPFDDRSALTERFDELFDGTEAILTEDRDHYAAALDQAGDNRKAGRLLADQYLIPMPHWAGKLSEYEKTLKVRIIDGDYDPERGLLAVRGPAQYTYRAGEIL